MGIVFLAVAAVLLVIGADLFAEHASGAGRMLGLGGAAAGLLLAGAEPEELVTALVAAVREQPGIAAGDAFGSNITMLTLVLGLAAVVRPAPMGRKVRCYAVGAAALAAIAAIVASTDALVSRPEAAVLVALYVVGVFAVWRTEHALPPIGEVNESLEDHEEIEAVGAGRALIVALAGLAILVGGGWLAVVGAERLVVSLGLSGSTVGLTLVALATTAELLALVWAAGRRDLDELAIAGVVGSVAYNATVTLGVAALVRPLATAGTLTAAWFAATLPLVAVLLGLGGRIGRVGGLLLMGLYVAFLYLQLAG